MNNPEATAMQKLICDVYKSPKKADLYLYVAKADGLARVPELLLEPFGAPKHCLTLVITPTRQLARTSGEKVLAAINEQGFYLQLPPQPDADMQRIHQHNNKLYGG